MNALSQLFGGMTQVWLNVAFVVCVFGVALMRPGRIRNLSMFRAATVFFAISLIAPSVGLFLMSSGGEGAASARANPFGGEVTTGMKLVDMLPVALYAVAFLTAIESLMPRPGETPADSE